MDICAVRELEAVLGNDLVKDANGASMSIDLGAESRTHQNSVGHRRGIECWLIFTRHGDRRVSQRCALGSEEVYDTLHSA